MGKTRKEVEMACDAKHCVGSKVMGMKIQARRRRGTSKRRWLGVIECRHGISESMGLSGEEVYDRATRWSRGPTSLYTGST